MLLVMNLKEGSDRSMDYGNLVIDIGDENPEKVMKQIDEIHCEVRQIEDYNTEDFCMALEKAGFNLPHFISEQINF